MAYKVWKSDQNDAPAVLIHCFVGNGGEVWQACQQLRCPKFHLIAVYDLPFDDFLTPWPAENVRKGEPPFGGQAKYYLDNLLNKILLDIDIQYNNNLYMVGYSLAGLFTMWAATQKDSFKGIGCVSASFWYPDFLPYLQSSRLSPQVQRVYLSLGDKESRTRHPLMCQVEQNTEAVVHWVEQNRRKYCFEMNPGNHFTEPDLRMGKAIKWLLETE